MTMFSMFLIVPDFAALKRPDDRPIAKKTDRELDRRSTGLWPTGTR